MISFLSEPTDLATGGTLRGSEVDQAFRADSDRTGPDGIKDSRRGRGDGVLLLYNGVTRASRIAKLVLGMTICVEVVGRSRRAYAGEPKIGDLVP